MRLYCSNCDNVDCQYCKYLGSYIDDDNHQGCNREISFDDFSKYDHYINELIPFWKIGKNNDLINEQYFQIIDFLNNIIFKSQIVNFYNKKGVIIDKEEKEWILNKT